MMDHLLTQAKFDQFYDLCDVLLALFLSITSEGPLKYS